MKYNKPSEDFSGVRLGDKRLDERLTKTVESMTENTQTSILSSCGKQDAKAFYRLLSNEKFTVAEIKEKGQKSTMERIVNSGVEKVLLAEDWTDISMSGHEKTAGLGYSSNNTLGIKVHSCIALTEEGTNLGLLTQEYVTRAEAKKEESKSELKKRPIVEKESNQWLETSKEALEILPENVRGIILCDREGDFYELYAEMMTLNGSFVVRVIHDRKTIDGDNAVQQLRRTKACGEAEVSIPRDTRSNTKARTAKMEVAYCSAAIARPANTSKKISESLTLNLVRITEIGDTSDPIEWLLATCLPLENADDAMKIVGYYVHRWKIERFHYILKSGCQVEKIQQRSYTRIIPVLFIYSVIAAFILALTYFARSNPDAPCDLFLDDHEWKLLFRLVTLRFKESGRIG